MYASKLMLFFKSSSIVGNRHFAKIRLTSVPFNMFSSLQLQEVNQMQKTYNLPTYLSVLRESPQAFSHALLAVTRSTNMS